MCSICWSQHSASARPEEGLEGLGHDDGAAGRNAGLELLRGVEVLDGSLDVSEAAVDGRQLGAPRDDADVHGIAALAAQVVLAGEHEGASVAGALVRGTDGEHSEIAARAPQLGVDAADELAGVVFGKQDFAFEEVGREAVDIGARAFEKRLDREGGVDDGDEARNVGLCRQSDAKGRGGLGVGERFFGHWNWIGGLRQYEILQQDEAAVDHEVAVNGGFVE